MPTGMISILIFNGFVCGLVCLMMVWFCFGFGWVSLLFGFVGLFVKHQNLGFICDAFSNSNHCTYVALFLDSLTVSPCGHIFLSISSQQFCTQKIYLLDVWIYLLLYLHPFPSLLFFFCFSNFISFPACIKSLLWLIYWIPIPKQKSCIHLN